MKVASKSQRLGGRGGTARTLRRPRKRALHDSAAAATEVNVEAAAQPPPLAMERCTPLRRRSPARLAATTAEPAPAVGGGVGNGTGDKGRGEGGGEDFGEEAVPADAWLASPRSPHCRGDSPAGRHAGVDTEPPPAFLVAPTPPEPRRVRQPAGQLWRSPPPLPPRQERLPE